MKHKYLWKIHTFNLAVQGDSFIKLYPDAYAIEKNEI